MGRPGGDADAGCDVKGQVLVSEFMVLHPPPEPFTQGQAFSNGVSGRITVNSSPPKRQPHIIFAYAVIQQLPELLKHTVAA
jgi:hypothetical protein